jgi:hypothetical protein
MESVNHARFGRMAGYGITLVDPVILADAVLGADLLIEAATSHCL